MFPLRIVVDGPSMLPTLDEGDRLLVLPLRPRQGRLIAVRDPRDEQRVLVKRVETISTDGVVVVGDNPGASTDSRHFGPVPRRLVLGRPVYRYSPSTASGVVR